MTPSFYFVEYELYGMKKNIIFQCFSQKVNWEWALGQLNEEGKVVFKITSIKEERY